MKKLLILVLSLLCLTILLFAFISCNNSSNDTSSTKDTNSTNDTQSNTNVDTSSDTNSDTNENTDSDEGDVPE